MTRKELEMAVADQLAQQGHRMIWKDVDAVLVAVGDVAAAELLGGGDVPLPKLGKLKSKDVAARTARNPRTGEKIDVPAGRKICFAACSELRDALKD